MIRGYSRTASVQPGETLTLHVSTDRPGFRVEVYRQGPTLERVEDGDAGPFPGIAVPEGPPGFYDTWPPGSHPPPIAAGTPPPPG